MRSPESKPEPYTQSFASRADFEAWAAVNVAEPQEFVQGTYEGIERWREWRAAGHGGLPPGAQLLRDFEREHPL